MVTRKHLRLTSVLFVLNLAALPVLSQAPPLPQPGGQGQLPPQGDPFGQPGRPGQPPRPGQPGFPPGGQFTPGPQPGFPGGQGFGPAPMMMPGPQSPELAKKTRSIMALRQMLEMRISSRNISAALPILKELRDAEKAMQSRAEQLLEEERKALLAAEPDDPMPPGAGEKMQMEMQRYNEKQARAWDNLTQAIGPEKTHGIRRLLGQGEPGFMPNLPGRFDGQGNPIGPPRTPQGQLRPVPGAGQPTRPAPGLPPGPNGPPPAEAPPAPELDAFGEVAPEAPVELQQQPPPVPRPGAPGQPGQQGQPTRPFRPNAGNQPFAEPRPGTGVGFPAQQNPFNAPFAPSPRLTLAELVELMEQRLAAARR